MHVRLLSFMVWALLACSGAYWLLKLLPTPLAVPPQAAPVGEGAVPRADLNRLFGAPPSLAVAETAPADGRYKLVGLVAPKQGSDKHVGEGVAVITVDNQPPRTVRIGAAVDGELQLLALDGKSAALGRDGVVSLRLDLAAPAPAARGSLPSAVATPVPALSPAPVPPPPPLQSLAPELNSPTSQLPRDASTR